MLGCFAIEFSATVFVDLAVDLILTVCLRRGFNLTKYTCSIFSVFIIIHMNFVFGTAYTYTYTYTIYRKIIAAPIFLSIMISSCVQIAFRIVVPYFVSIFFILFVFFRLHILFHIVQFFSCSLLIFLDTRTYLSHSVNAFYVLYNSGYYFAVRFLLILYHCTFIFFYYAGISPMKPLS